MVIMVLLTIAIQEAFRYIYINQYFKVDARLKDKSRPVEGGHIPLDDFSSSFAAGIQYRFLP
jgi:hypothetical protein